MESDEFRTAVAAAAFAVDSVEERRRTRRRRDGGLSKPKTKQEDGAVSATASRRIRERMASSSGASNKTKNKEDDMVPISTPSFLSRKFSELQEKMPQRANSPANTNTGFKPQSSLPSSSNDTKPTNYTTTQTGISEVNKRRSELRPEDIKAESWEKTEMERIKERYERLMVKILEWENEKKAKAHKKLSRHKDDEPEKKRARALQNYNTDIEMIEQIAEGARSQAEENRRKEVIKAKKKADTIRLTGEIPKKTCLCF
ncbi:uncharacterized protein LOC143555071 [Bidens hawaiensis]|uniref:uncharacterized protein LOC143555071 n=1 Tax=Bidens hawaiensis TaxID=980011 RepID=UPI00404A154A